MLQKWRAPPRDDGLRELRGLSEAATPLSWASEDSVRVHSAINTLENCRLKDLRLSTLQRVKLAPASFHKMIKRIAEGDEETKSVSFADAGLAAPSPSPPGPLPPADSDDVWTQSARHSESARVVRGKNHPAAGAFDIFWYPRRPALPQACLQADLGHREVQASVEPAPATVLRHIVTRAPSVCESEVSQEDMDERDRRKLLQTSAVFGCTTSAPDRFASIMPYRKDMVCFAEQYYNLGADVVEPCCRATCPWL